MIRLYKINYNKKEIFNLKCLTGLNIKNKNY